MSLGIIICFFAFIMLFVPIAPLDRIVDIQQRGNLAADPLAIIDRYRLPGRINENAQAAATMTGAELQADKLQPQVRNQGQQKLVEFLVCHVRSSTRYKFRQKKMGAWPIPEFTVVLHPGHR